MARKKKEFSAVFYTQILPDTKSLYISHAVSNYYGTEIKISHSRFGQYFTLFKTEELFLINYPVLLTPDLGCIYYEYS